MKVLKCVVFLFAYFLLASLSNFANASSSGYTPDQIKAAYGLPSSGGSGTVAIILWGGSPNIESDLNNFSNAFNLPSCTQANGCLTIHLMSSNLQRDPGADGEISMDTQWVHAIAPQTKILVVEAASAATGNLVQAIQYANSQPEVTTVTMSFGNFGDDGINFPCDVFSNPKISYFAASGDWGNGMSTPAICPQVIAVGGTRLIMDGNSVVSEVGWSCSFGETDPNTGNPSCTGGGVSQNISEPSFQSNFNIPNSNGFRGFPDVAAIADPAYGAPVSINGVWRKIGGTSLSSPIWAGIAALNGGTITHESLYANASQDKYANYYRDITQGDNGNCGAICNAGVGYDFVTGLGSPIALPGSSGNTNPNPGGGTVSPSISPTVTPVSYSISGSVFNDINGNGTQDSGESGISGATLNLSGPVGGTKSTDSSGNYSFDNLSSGNYFLVLNYNGVSSKPVAIPLTSTINAEIVNFGIQSTGGQQPVINPVVLSPTPTIVTPEPTQGSGGGGDSGGGSGGSGFSGGFQPHGSPTPTPSQYYTCAPDPGCVSGQKNIQLCPLKCTPQG